MRQIPKPLQNSYRFLIDLLFPNRCPCCGRMIAWDELICETCCMETMLEESALCSGCGKTFANCMCKEGMRFDGATAACRYEGRARQGVLSLKEAENLNFAWYSGRILGEHILQKEDWMMADAIVPVPMQRYQRILRGQNPAKRIADTSTYGFALEKTGRCAAAYVKCCTTAAECFAICSGRDSVGWLYSDTL